ncbi:SDR family NAD(P)-dependent oxidoreductase [Paenibacillus nuruki]|uniref:SDR family NAD(P)-dependent oxidoreductase n=1 Tax=Paenibacillus nuruki TaxID=1886670 RepID=UPI0028064492|nr:glucose 1-dehydrogenase [Paenibacillus nuruki]CAJ1314840.1 7-alpha-hydroxysteroid dehydrogenase [Paenibacillus nuruki]
MYLPSFSLSDKKAIVTGAGKGIGQALAIGLAQAGADVGLIARTGSDLEVTKQLIEKHSSRKAICIPADVTDREQMQSAFDRFELAFGAPDILVNNAGMNIRSKALDVTDSEWHTIVDTNLHSALIASQMAAHLMKEHGGGKIINIASVGGHTALRTGVVYGATKAGLIHMTKILAMEWAQYGIQVNGVGPWYFRTPLTETILADEQYMQDILDRTPMKRVGNLEEVVGPVVFLASESAGYITGQTIMVDGGMSVFGF